MTNKVLISEEQFMDAISKDIDKNLSSEKMRKLLKEYTLISFRYGREFQKYNQVTVMTSEEEKEERYYTQRELEEIFPEYGGYLMHVVSTRLPFTKKIKRSTSPTFVKAISKREAIQQVLSISNKSNSVWTKERLLEIKTKLEY